MSFSRPRFPDDHFTRIPNAWIRDPRLTSNAFRILSVILSHDAHYKLSVAQVMRETGLGRDAIQAATKHMLELGYLLGVAQRVTEAGRFGENHYTLTDCTGLPQPGASPSDPELSGRNVRIGPLRSDPAAVPDRSGAIPPLRRTPTTEDQEPLEEHPAPDGSGARHLAAVAEDEAAKELERVVNALAAEHWEATGKVTPFPGVRSIIKVAITAGHPEPQVRAALAALRRQRRSLTRNALGLLLADPGKDRSAVTGANYGPLYQNPDPKTHPDAFSGSF